MFQTNVTTPWYNYYPREHLDILEKYNNVCRVVHELSDIIKHLEEKIKMIEKKELPGKRIPKRCRYYNSGYCKLGGACLFAHPEETCQEYLRHGKCPDLGSCEKRHPKVCRYWKEKKCFREQSCLYLHQELLVENHSRTKKLVTIELNGKKMTVSNMEELDDDMINVMTADDILKFYENEFDHDVIDEELIENDCASEEPEEITVDEIMRMYETEPDDDETEPDDDETLVDKKFSKVNRKDSKNRKKPRHNDVGLQKSTKYKKK